MRLSLSFPLGCSSASANDVIGYPFLDGLQPLGEGPAVEDFVDFRPLEPRLRVRAVVESVIDKGLQQAVGAVGAVEAVPEEPICLTSFTGDRAPEYFTYDIEE